MNKSLLIAAGLTSCLMLSACSTLFGDNGRSLVVNTQPQGAEVYLNNQPVGKSPVTVELASVTNNYLQVSKNGYQNTSVPIDTTFQKVGLFNILFWPGFIVDAVSGDMMRLSSTSITIPLATNDATTLPSKTTTTTIGS